MIWLVVLALVLGSMLLWLVRSKEISLGDVAVMVVAALAPDRVHVVSVLQACLEPCCPLLHLIALYIDAANIQSLSYEWVCR